MGLRGEHRTREQPAHTQTLLPVGPAGPLTLSEGDFSTSGSRFSEQHCPSRGPVLRKLTPKEMKSSETGQDVKCKLEEELEAVADISWAASSVRSRSVNTVLLFLLSMQLEGILFLRLRHNSYAHGFGVGLFKQGCVH